MSEGRGLSSLRAEIARSFDAREFMVGRVERRVFDELLLAAPEGGTFVSEPPLKIREQEGVVVLGPPQTFAPTYRNALIAAWLVTTLVAGAAMVLFLRIESGTTSFEGPDYPLIIGGILGGWGLLMVIVAYAAALIPWATAKRRGLCLIVDKVHGRWTLPRQGISLTNGVVQAVHVGRGSFSIKSGGPERGVNVVQVTVEYLDGANSRFAPVWCNDKVMYERLVRRLTEVLPVAVRECRLGNAEVTGLMT